MCDALFHFNGIDGTSGEYLQHPLTAEEVVALLDRDFPPRMRGVAFGIDRCSLDQSGWGAVFARGADPEVRKALEPLLAHRKSQVEKQRSGRFRVYDEDDGYRAGDSAGVLMSRLGVGPGPVDPTRAPYFLLLVGGPDTIPYHVQYELDLGFAVGRVSFDTPEEYALYAESVVAAETGRVQRSRRVCFLAPSHDFATRQSCNGLASPLAQYLEDRMARGNGWEIEAYLADTATRERFARVLGGEDTPALAFTATHGVGFPTGDPRQRAEQGAFLCPDGDEPDEGGERKMRLFGAGQVTDSASPAGLVSFHFACYGAGSPFHDDFSHLKPDEPPQEVAPEALVAALPQRLLGHPKGGALAFIGHVDRAWGWSYVAGHDKLADYHRQVFEATLAEILTGYPVGVALDRIGERHGQLAGMLAAAQQRRRYGEAVDTTEYAHLLTATHDARNYVLLGDPAVRLAVDWEEAT